MPAAQEIVRMDFARATLPANYFTKILGMNAQFQNGTLLALNHSY